MKNITLIYCGEDGEAGKVLAHAIRAKDADNVVMLASCEFFDGAQSNVDQVIIMPDVPEHRAAIVRAAYPEIIKAQPTEVATDLALSEPIPDSYPAKRKPGRPRKVAA